MVTPKTLAKIAHKWQKAMVSTGRRRRRRRRRISLPRTRSSSKVADKGHFVVYTLDHKRCVLPISYLGNYVLRELLKMSEEEFGLPADGPIKLPCEAAFVEYIVYLIRRHVDFEVEKALVLSIAPAVKGCCGSNLFSSAARSRQLPPYPPNSNISY
ncbi:Auxin-responsive protein SAUR66, partial [Cucurbita argyrosperma subsp. argyrosperma]